MSVATSMLKIVEIQGTRSIKYVKPVKPGEETGLLSEVYAQVRQGFGAVVAPFSLHSPVPEITAAAWSVTRESLIAGEVPRSHKEAISAAVSRSNRCPYCVDAHTISLYAVSEPVVASAITEGEPERIADPRLRSLVSWALACRRPESEIVSKPPFAPEEAPEIIGTAVAFQHINRMANIFLDETPMPVKLPAGGMKRAMKRVSGFLMREIINSSTPAGESLSMLPEAPLPPDLAWAQANPAVAGAYARAAAVMDRAAEAAIPDAVRALVHDTIQRWRGEEMGLSRGWVEPLVASLKESDRPAARLALLTALASYQVDEKVVAEFRRQYPHDAALITLTSWASFTATRRVGSWLVAPQAEAAV